jgi:hypothetical protein
MGRLVGTYRDWSRLMDNQEIITGAASKENCAWSAYRVRRERWWSTAGVKPARELVRSTR